MSAAPLKATRVGKRQFYPAATRPTSPELSQHKRRRAKWFPIQKQIWKRTSAYQAALNYLKRPNYRKQAIWAGLITLALGLGSWWLFSDPFTRALRTGFTKTTGEFLPPVSNTFFTILAIQGALSVFGFMVVAETKRRNGAVLLKERYEEWLRRQDVTQEDLQRTLLPQYETENPYDPSDPDINFVLGEYYDNDAHKFGPVAHWYTMKMKGLQTGGMIIFGVTGAGKTSSVLRPIMRQAFGWMAHVSFDPDNRGREKTAGFVADPKGSLAEDTRQVLRTAGTDPILDPLQATESNPAVTPLLHLLHEGKDQVDPAILAAYRGREDDYLELGYDEGRVNRIWDHFQSIQTVATRLLRDCKAPRSGPDEMPNYLEGAEVRIQGEGYSFRGEDGATVQVSFSEGALQVLSGAKSQMPRKVMLAAHAAFRQIPWNGGSLRHGDATAPLYRRLDGLLQALFLGREEPSPALDPSARGVGLPIHPRIPGLLFSARNTLESFAATRNLIRRFAPTKQSPSGTLREYRANWLLREARLWDFSEVQVGMARRVMSEASLAVLDAPLDYEDLTLQMKRDAEAFSSQVARDLAPLATPLRALLGPGAVAPEYSRPPLSPTDPMRALMAKVKSSLDPRVTAKLVAGDWEAYSVPTSEVPKPFPVSKEAEARLKGRYSAPDPIVLLVLRAGELREREGALTDRILAGVGKGFERALGEVRFVVKGVAADVSNRVTALGGEPLAQLERVMGEILAAQVQAWGGREGLASDLVATYLGMFALPAPGVDFHRLAPLGGQIEAFAAQVLSASRFRGMAHEDRLARAADAVAESWMELMAPPTALLRAILKSSRLDEAKCDLCFSHFVGAIKSIQRTWVTAHMAALEAVVEAPDIYQEVDGLCREGLAFAKELDPLVMGGGGFLAGHGAEPTQELPWFKAIWTHELRGTKRILRHGPFWRGPMGARDMTPLHASQWDSVWGKTTWTVVTQMLTAIPIKMAIHEYSLGNHSAMAMLSERGAFLAEYHCACLESFRVTVAPNIAWRTDGPFAFNPLYAPDLSPIVVAGTFNATVFAATSEGKDSSDPFWENASFTTVFNCLQTLNLVDGYATFPKIDTLVTNEEVLREYLDELRDRLKTRRGRSEDMETITNILKWADGEWLTTASAKSETKDNIIRSLSVVTQPFKEPKFAVCFAPAVKEDISFPSFTWVMREGKIVACHLPFQKYEKIAKVVLPLANKNFMQSVTMRDGLRVANNRIVAHNRGEIELLWQQAHDLQLQIQNDAAELRVLEVFFRTKKGPGDHLLSVWSAAKDTNAILLGGSQVCMGDAFMSPARLSALKREALIGFLLGATAAARPYDGAYLSAGPPGRAGIEAGFFALLLNRGGTKLGSVQRDNPAAKRLVEAIQGALHATSQDDGGAGLWLGTPEELAASALELPSILLEPITRSLGQEVRLRLVTKYKRHMSDQRSSSSDDAAPMAAGHGDIPAVKLGRVMVKIRELEDEIAEMPNTERPVVYMVDEAHYFVQGKADADFVSVARSCKALNFFATQSPNALMAKMEEAVAKQFLDNLPNRVILRMPDSKSAESCAEYLGGKKRFQVVETNVSQNFKDVRADTIKGGGRGQSEGGSVSVSMKEEERWVVDLQAIVNLQAMEAYAMVWDGKKNSAPRRIYTKPDYLFTVPEARRFKRTPGTIYATLPKDYPEGMDLYSLTVPRLLELGVIDASRG